MVKVIDIKAWNSFTQSMVTKHFDCDYCKATNEFVLYEIVNWSDGTESIYSAGRFATEEEAIKNAHHLVKLHGLVEA